MINFDIVIIGKTITGLALACGLPSNFKIAILDYIDKRDIVNTMEVINVSMINLFSARFLRYLKIWDNYIVHYANPYRSIRVAEGDSFNCFMFKNSYLGYPYLGYIVDTSILYKTLLCRAHELKNIFFFDNISLHRIVSTKYIVHIVIRGQSLSAKLIVVADVGQNSSLYQKLDVSSIFWNYPYNILVGTIFSEYSHKKIVHYFFQKKNILVLLPLIKSHYSFVFWLLYSCSSDDVLNDFNRNQWGDLFMRSFNNFGHVVFQEDLHYIPCVFQYVRSFSKSRLLLLGGASDDVSPFKYQNINQGLMNVARLLEIIKNHEDFLQNIGGVGSFCLDLYEQYKREVAITTFIKAQCIRSYFFGTNVTNQYIRTLVFKIINHSSSIITKFDFINNLMGYNNIPDWLLEDYYD